MSTPPSLTLIFSFTELTRFAKESTAMKSVGDEDAATLHVGFHVHERSPPLYEISTPMKSVAHQDAATLHIGLHVHEVHLLSPESTAMESVAEQDAATF